MVNKDIWLRDGVNSKTGAYMEFAACKTDNGKISYWGYDPRSMSFEGAAEKLESECANRGFKILPKEGLETKLSGRS
jgi:hypothetical protein